MQLLQAALKASNQMVGMIKRCTILQMQMRKKASKYKLLDLKKRNGPPQ